MPFLHGGGVDRFHWLTERQFLDVPTVAILLATFGLLAATKNIPEPLVILAAGGIGLAAKGLAH